MVRTYLNQVKHKMFPGMDFTKEQTELKNKPVRKKTMFEFIWFDRDGFTLIYYGNPLVTAAIMAAGGILFAFLGIYIATGILSIICLFMLKDFAKKLKNRKAMKGMTMYDWYLKEEVLGDVQ